jgi:hypothetical protein
VTITEFTAARLADLAEADWHVFDCSGMPHEDGQCCDAQRWLARDVAAKRAILAEYVSRHDDAALMLGPDCLRQQEWSGLHLAVLLLAAAWCGHPDYDPAWAPETAEAR